jgi:hypothetical protein
LEQTTPQRVFLRYPKTFLVGFIIALTLLLDVTLTSAWHLIKYGTIHKNVARRVIGARDPVFHHGLKPNTVSQEERWGAVQYTVFTNSMGFRDKEIRDVPLQSARYRILFLGDSFALGMGYHYPQTFVGIVADGLASRGVEVLNAASASYSPAIYFKKAEYYLETVGLRFDHLVLAIDVSDVMDEAQCYDIRNGSVESRCDPPAESILGEAWRYFHEHTSIHRNLVRLYENYLQRFLSDDPESRRTLEERHYGTNDPRSAWTVDAAGRDSVESGIAKARRHMDLLHGLLARHHIELTIVVYPWPDQVIHRDLDSLHVRLWRDWAAEHGVRFIDLFPDFIRDGQDPKQVIAEYYIQGDVHFNEKGYHLVGRRLLDELQPLVPRPTVSLS